MVPRTQGTGNTMTAHITSHYATWTSTRAYSSDLASFIQWADSWTDKGFTVEYTIPAYGDVIHEALIHRDRDNMTIYATLHA
jgi:hypothetical protein